MDGGGDCFGGGGSSSGTAAFGNAGGGDEVDPMTMLSLAPPGAGALAATWPSDPGRRWGRGGRRQCQRSFGRR
ncbi:hypothetical protein RHGRI_016212 [Rhododendron griersonianum]|uniref:Uncharacterized protein n=1 Tax=Rhododendron griersonianum TaxID=479676 RepID=A0AAV6JRF7_9ERIC|nr:hypothetical protein RHGRI_016212 [Rhododendron griersonianum]